MIDKTETRQENALCLKNESHHMQQTGAFSCDMEYVVETQRLNKNKIRKVQQNFKIKKNQKEKEKKEEGKKWRNQEKE